MNADTPSDTAGDAAGLRQSCVEPPPGPNLATDLVGTGRLILAGVNGVTNVVEGMHRNISGLAPLVGASRPGPTRGITGLVYRNIRRVTALTGSGLDFTLKRLAPLFPEQPPSLRREAALSALNGVFGDHLAATGNPLAIPMQLRSDGIALALDRRSLQATFAPPSGRLLVLVHGLCMSDQQWRRQYHDHGESLAQDLGFTPLYLRYNSGRPVTDNGREFAALLETLVDQWPVAIDELVILCHSMGGLVSRSACWWAQETRHRWPARLNKLVFLGTPHFGAPLERLGTGLDFILGISPYSAPIGRIGKARSAGIRDLREGNIGDGTTAAAERPAGFPAHTQCYAIAASTRAVPPAKTALDPGDGLVPLKSALGEHSDTARSLPIPVTRQAVFRGLNHFELLDDQRVYQRLLRWLEHD